MATYEPPVSRLLDIGRPEVHDETADYLAFGIGSEHIPELIRLLQDRELREIDAKVPADEDVPSWYAHIHAWRVLGQLRAEAAIDPLLVLIDDNQNDEDWSDWVTEEVPEILGKIGPPAVAPIASRLEKTRRERFLGWTLARALTAIAEEHPETRTDVVNRLIQTMELAAENHPVVNGGILCQLLELKAVEAWPTIEKAFATGNVDAFIAGDADRAKWRLGLGPEPPRRRFHPPFSLSPSHPLSPAAKERAKKRAKKEKAAKRKRRKQGR